MYSLRERLFILDSEHRKERNKVQNINLRVFYGWSKVNKIRKKEAISVIFENDRQSEERTLRTVGKFQETVYIRKQTDGEKQDAEHSNRMFTEYSVFMDDKRINGSLDMALLVNRNADRNNVSKKVLDEIETELRRAYLMAHRDYKEPVRQLELFTLTD
nr:MAG TPA: hypothetical protein [Caudoviricetes sp.]